MYRIILSLGLVAALTAEIPLRYDQCRIWIDSSQDLVEIASLGVDFEGSRYKQGVFIDLIINEEEHQQLIDRGFHIEILQEDMAAYYASQLSVESVREFGLGSMGGYYTYAEALASMDSLAAQYPNIVTQRDSIGETIEGRAIWTFKISDNPQFPDGEPEVFFNSLTHAREPASLMTVMYYAWYLAENYGTDPFVTYLVDNREIWFVPVINPDGYLYNELTNPDGGGMHRKNRRPGCTSNPGVDLNRNWGYMWGYDDVGSSPDPCSNTYRGTEAFSEPETETIREFVLSHNFITVFNCHTHGDVLLRPFGYSPDVEIPEPDLSTYLELGADLVTENGYEFGTGMETLNYGVNGDAIDWMYGSEGIISFVPEIGNGFWPASDLIMSIVNENIPMNLHLTAVADFTPRLESFVFDTEEVIGTGGTYPAEIVVRNKAIVHGDETEAVTVTVFSPDSSISVPIPEYNITDLQALSSDTLNDSYTILAQNSQIATLVIGLSVSEGSNAYTLYDTLVWRIGPPDTLFSDDFENGMDQWLSDSWALTDAGYENTTGLTDSPDGEYQDNDEAEVILIETLDLSSMVAPELRFDVTWDIENGWDFAQVRASCNGGLNWVPLEGSYTSRGTGMGAQEAGEPGYDGSSDWVHESMSLEAFAECEEVTLQFILLSDTYVTGDGITIDNVHVIAWNPAFSGLLGDLNLDDTVNVQDVVLMISWIIESVDPGDAGLAAADLNRDQQLNILDVILLIELILSQ